MKKISRPISNESGMTLVIVMVLSVVALMIMSALLYMVWSGTQISGMQKRYATATEAAKGGVGVAREIINTKGAPGLAGLGFQNTTEGNNCTQVKLTQPTANWGVCNSSITLNPGDNAASATASYDSYFSLGNYTVYAKIVDTVPGNTAQGAGLLQTGTTNPTQSPVQAEPYLYTIEVLSQGRNSQGTILPERSRIMAVYQY